MKNLNSFIKENAQNNVTYVTEFNLAVDVPVKEADKYLQEDDMVEYLKDELKNNTTLKPTDLLSLVWAMDGSSKYSDHGTITLETTRELTDRELAIVSKFVSGQNSDGLGEGFEQRFEVDDTPVNYTGYSTGYDDEEDEDYADSSTALASFDWKTNNYRFKKK